MISLWGYRAQRRRHYHDDGTLEDDVPQPTPSIGNERPQDPDEGTRLLSDEWAHLSPDDPAVTPYNLLLIRVLRYMSLLFFVASLIWWVLLLISLFISPPAMHSRGSGFFALSFTTLTIENILIALVFFTIPSKPMKLFGSILSLFLGVDMIITLAVPRIRHEEGWIGVASVVWATFIGLYNTAQNHYVGWGKGEEEERLTGREETRRTLREWLAVFVSAVIMGIQAITAILITASLTLRSRELSLAPPGHRYYVDSHEYQVHIACVGNITHEGYTILLEAGEMPVEDTFQRWIHDAYRHGTIGRYCYWDRPGFGWSDNAPSPYSAGMAADALSEVLTAMDERGPWVLVSAGIGGVYSRIFASRHGGDIKGMLLIDVVHEDFLSDLASPSRGILLWFRGMISPLGLETLASTIFHHSTREDRVFGKYAYVGGRYIKARLQENLVAKSMTYGEISSARNNLSSKISLAVVSSGVEARKNEEWSRKQEDLTEITETLVAWDTVKDAPHEVWRTLEGRQILEKRLGQLARA
ncbi:hypothetical protein BDV38DRAFT_290619 [Aspergillus pseudotamarii]|uniref:Uncharacterized protein n=1 Tax=Aspergillus pseudotamarii TaxID=132259 RepID=A0A5N6SCW0_ASPPS|nr:uncharacterized protein BDV38DRAFT_290619 [Aspergillus pseudotamarii]KAE8131213.1 hypothetical protein BDV38DRAFT_290619 [Aspergillus pseudotamarii]